MLNGCVSVEPRVRRSSSQGSLVRSQSASLFGDRSKVSKRQANSAAVNKVDGGTPPTMVEAVTSSNANNNNISPSKKQSNLSNEAFKKAKRVRNSAKKQTNTNNQGKKTNQSSKLSPIKSRLPSDSSTKAMTSTTKVPSITSTVRSKRPENKDESSAAIKKAIEVRKDAKGGRTTKPSSRSLSPVKSSRAPKKQSALIEDQPLKPEKPFPKKKREEKSDGSNGKRQRVASRKSEIKDEKKTRRTQSPTKDDFPPRSKASRSRSPVIKSSLKNDDSLVDDAKNVDVKAPIGEDSHDLGKEGWAKVRARLSRSSSPPVKPMRKVGIVETPPKVTLMDQQHPQLVIDEDDEDDDAFSDAIPFALKNKSLDQTKNLLSTSNLPTSSSKQNLTAPAKRMTKSVSNLETAIPSDDLFIRDELPTFAKSYILPKVMRKESIEQQKKRLREGGETQDVRNRTVSTGGADYDIVTSSTSSSATNDAFKFSMLKASLDFDSQIPKGEGGLGFEARRNTRSSFGNALDPTGGLESGRSSRMTSTTLSSWKQGRRRPLSKVIGSPKKSLVPCEGPGSLKEYGEYLKAGGYVPLPVLDPEEGIKVGIYSKDPIMEENEDDLFDDALDIRLPLKSQMDSASGTLNAAQETIDTQYDAIVRQYGEAKGAQVVEEKATDPALQALFGGTTPKRQPLYKAPPNDAKKPKAKPKFNGDDLLLDDDDSGVSSARTNMSSGSNNGGGLVSRGSTLPPLFGEENDWSSTPPPSTGPNLLSFEDPSGRVSQMSEFMSQEEKDARQQLADQKLIQDAMAGQNLLSMMIDEPKPKYGQQSGMQGTDAIDMFIDPLSVFGSDRHPALQEVLKQIDKTKKSRGEYLKLKGD